jgi:sporulation protein YlmC with PRC-barrel domain
MASSFADIAQIVAPAATMIAAMMTAANLSPRITGWGFVVFTVGSIGWCIIGLSSGQQNLLLSNAFLTLVNLVGIWRWLGRQARYADGSRKATQRSEIEAGSSIMPISGLAGSDVLDCDGAKVATVVDAMVSRERGTLAYAVISVGGVGGVGETLHGLAAEAMELAPDGIRTPFSEAALRALPTIDVDHWPTRVAAPTNRSRST